MATCTVPFPITEKVLTAHSLAEPSLGEQAWSSEATYAANEKVIVGAPTATVTISNAAPAVITWNANGVPNGTPVILTTTGVLPAGLEAGELYYVVNRATNSFQLSATPDGPPIATTSAGSGVHTAKASIHTTYVSQVDGNTGNPPAIDDGGKWFPVGPTNLWSMIDLYRPTMTWAPSPFSFELTPGQRTLSIFLGSLDAEEIAVEVKVGGVTKYTATESLYTRTTFTPTEFCFKPWSRRTEVQLLDLPLKLDPVITVTITKSTGLVGVGEVVIGNPEFLGKTQYGAKSRARNYTKFDRRSDGTPNAPVRQRNVLSGDWTIMFDKAATQNLMDLRDKTNGVVCVWSGLDDDAHEYFPAVLILGLAMGFDLDLTFPQHGLITLSPEEY